MIYEDAEAEAAVTGGDFDIAIPFSLTLRGTELEIEVYPSQRGVADEFLRRFGSADFFSSEAIAWVREALAPYLSANGFEACEENNDYFLEYRVVDIDRSLVIGETLRMNGGDSVPNLTGYDFAAMTGFGHICFGTLADGAVVSAACTNSPVEDSCGAVEIGVETVENYRGRGFGLSSAAALIRELSDRGIAAIYECESKNIASRALIVRLGGVLQARVFRIAGIRTANI